MIHQNTSIGAITLKVADLEKMVAFYRDVIGLQVLENSAETSPDITPAHATLGTETRPLLHLRHLPDGTRLPRQSGLFHLALRVSDQKALGTWLRHYVALNGPGWQGAADHGASNALYLGDPEGNGIEVYFDLPREQWEYDANGTLKLVTEQLDLQALLARADEGTFRGIDPATVMGHIHLRVSDISNAKQFYVDLFGFELQMEMSNSALFISAGGYHHHVGLNVWQSRGGPLNSAESLGLESYEICFDSAESRQQTIDRLTDHAHTLNIINGVPTIRDPFHNTIALTVPGA